MQAGYADRGNVHAVSTSAIAYEAGGRAAKTGGSLLEVANLTGTGRRGVTSHPPGGSRRRTRSAWSPDGTRLVFTRINSPDGGLYVVDADGGRLRRLYATRGSQSLDPAWSPDGTSVAFNSSAAALPHTPAFAPVSCVKGRPSPNGLLSIAVDGSSPPALIAGGGDDKTVISGEAWSPNGEQLLYVENRTCSYDQGTLLAVVNADGTGRHIVARGQTPAFEKMKGTVVSRASWSPDGTRISYTSACSQVPGDAVHCDIGVMGADGAKKRLVAGHLTDDPWCDTSDPILAEVPVWGPGGHSILVSMNGLGGLPGAGGGAGVYEKNLDTGKVRRVTADRVRAAVAHALAGWRQVRVRHGHVLTRPCRRSS